MLTYSVFDAKTHLSAILDKIEAGEEVVITKNNRPVAHMRSIDALKKKPKKKKDVFLRLETLRKKLPMTPDDDVVLSIRQMRDERTDHLLSFFK
ncbi:MAG: type II toxin-antitoxin system Phd/YefM family antitoxin [Holosporales bacterium]|jgi:prevent-host-death family protein